jgi:hypothetical protein
VTLKDTLLDPSKRPAVVSDLNELVGQEASEKGMIIKAAFATVSKAKPGFVPSAVDKMLPQFSDALEPFYADYKIRGGAGFGAYLASRPTEASEALLSVTDDRAEYSSSEIVKKTYNSLRPKALKNVEEALPRLGTLIEKHAG